MSEKEYKERRKKNITNFLIFYTIICVFFIVSYTLSRYVNTTTSSVGIGIAKFNVKVNDISVEENQPFELKFSEVTTFMSKKIAPDNSEYFEIIINTAGTEVSLEYEFKFNLSEINQNFKLLYYTINDSENHYDMIDNTIQNQLLLPSNEKGFSDSEKIDIKVYWSWNEEEDFINPDLSNFDNKNLGVSAVIKQKIE